MIVSRARAADLRMGRGKIDRGYRAGVVAPSGRPALPPPGLHEAQEEQRPKYPADGGQQEHRPEAEGIDHLPPPGPAKAETKVTA